MLKFYLTLCTIIFISGAYSQNVSLNDLVNYTGYTPARFGNIISKRGYRTAGFGSESFGTEGKTYTWHNKKKEDTGEKVLFKSDQADKAIIGFQTTSADEFAALRKQLKEEGYHCTEGAKNELYQKGPITIQPVKREDGEKTVYSFSIERRALPKAKDLVFAEDFMQLTSHEYLSTVFGEAAVKRDMFYFSEKEVNRCSVLYPNTSRQVIFIWKDEENLREPAFLLVGGQLQSQSSLSYNSQIEQNVWQSKQGIYAGMSLRELQRLNGGPINIWGWQSDQPGVVSETNTGTLDFKNVHLVLNCLDCNGSQNAADNKLLNSEDVLRQGRRVYVSTIIVLPKK
jgi:hypothetical protein